MKSLIALSLLSLSATAFSADWKVFAESVDCGEKVQILAKDGEKYVQAKVGDKTTKLNSTDGTAFAMNGGKSTVFTSEVKDTHLNSPSYEFTQPSVQDSTPPKVIVSSAGAKKNCNMKGK